MIFESDTLKEHMCHKIKQTPIFSESFFCLVLSAFSKSNSEYIYSKHVVSCFKLHSYSSCLNHFLNCVIGGCSTIIMTAFQNSYKNKETRTFYS